MINFSESIVRISSSFPNKRKKRFFNVSYRTIPIVKQPEIQDYLSINILRLESLFVKYHFVSDSYLHRDDKVFGNEIFPRNNLLEARGS